MRSFRRSVNSWLGVRISYRWVYLVERHIHFVLGIPLLRQIDGVPPAGVGLDQLPRPQIAHRKEPAVLAANSWLALGSQNDFAPEDHAPILHLYRVWYTIPKALDAVISHELYCLPGRQPSRPDSRKPTTATRALISFSFRMR